MGNFGKLSALQSKCDDQGSVSDEDMKLALSYFRILGCLWADDLSEEIAAFKSIQKAYNTKDEGSGYW
jgi:hypothetical protein